MTRREQERARADDIGGREPPPCPPAGGRPDDAARGRPGCPAAYQQAPAAGWVKAETEHCRANRNPAAARHGQAADAAFIAPSRDIPP